MIVLSVRKWANPVLGFLYDPKPHAAEHKSLVVLGCAIRLSARYVSSSPIWGLLGRLIARASLWVHAWLRKQISVWAADVRRALKALPREAKIGLAVPAALLVLLIVMLAVSLFTAFIRPGAMAYNPYGIGAAYGDEQAYYCRYLAATKEKSGTWPVTCQAPEMLASVLTPFTPNIHYDGDKYAWGNCTYWAALRRAQTGRPVPNTWGDAYTWASRAARDGYTVDHTPTQGAVMQRGWGLGHVAYVESINADGSWRISEMNVVGYNVVDYRTLPLSAAANYYFIH